MAIFKANVTVNYTVIPNETAQDLSISFEARGLLSLMLSLPSDWEIHKSWLVNQSPICGRDKLTRIMKELQEAGYVRKVIKQDAKGKMDGCDWLVYPKSSTENRTTANPSNGIPVTTKETSLQIKHTNKDSVVSKGNIDYSEIEIIYHECLPNAPKIAKLTDKRKKLIKSFFSEFNMDNEKLKNYFSFLNENENFKWLFETRSMNNGTNAVWQKKKIEYFLSEKCYLDAKEFE